MSPEGTLEQLLAARASTVVADDQRVANVGEVAARAASALRRRGVRRGDAVAFQLGNQIETVVLYRACWRLGAVAMALHHRMGTSERDELLDRLSPVLVMTEVDDVRELGEHDGRHETVDADPDDDAVVLFTAGSTAQPKGVRHTHRGLAYKADLMVEVHELSAPDVVLMPAPLAHISGLLNGLLVPGVAGMTTVLMDRWSPADALELIERERVSFMVGPPTFFVDLMDDPSFSPTKVESLRLVSSGGAGVTPDFVDRASAALGARVKRSYGSTEAPTVATSLSSDDLARAREFDGHAIGEARLRIVDGELQVRGPELFVGYLSTEQTKEAMADGWFRTGDLATLTDDGWLRIVGRKKDIIIRAGENIAIRELEDVLEANPAVSQAAVLGVDHRRLGEQVVAVVTTTGRRFTVDDCRRWFEAQGVARFKIPEVVLTLPELPLLPTGKLDRARVRAMIETSDAIN